MIMENKDGTIASSGKSSGAKAPLSKSAIKDMSKHKAQQILRQKNPELLQKIEEEVAAQAASLKRKIMVVGFLIVVAAVTYVLWQQGVFGR